MTNDEYAIYLTKQSDADLIQILSNVDKFKFPEKYNAIRYELSQRNNSDILEVRSVNFAALLLPWLWGPLNRVYISLLVFLPFFGLFVPIFLFFKGNELAWKKQKGIISVGQFIKKQNIWSRSVLSVFVAVVVSLMVIFESQLKGQLYESSYKTVVNNVVVNRWVSGGFDTPLLVYGSHSYKRGLTCQSLFYSLSGKNGSLDVKIDGCTRDSIWNISSFFVVNDDGDTLHIKDLQNNP